VVVALKNFYPKPSVLFFTSVFSSPIFNQPLELGADRLFEF
jgi:hypothetical protein